MIDEASESHNNETLSTIQYMMSCLSWQEGLLQSYRGYLIYVQTVLFAITTSIFVYFSSINNKNYRIILICVLYAVMISGIYLLIIARRFIREREKCVDWWQKEIINAERSLTGILPLKTFRISKSHNFELPISELIATMPKESMDLLRRKDRPGVRRFFDFYIVAFGFLWVLVGLIGISDLLIK